MSSDFDLITIDPIAGTMESVAELGGFFQAPCWQEGPISMDFDRQGGLWVVVLGGETCILPAPVINYSFFPNPADGISEPRLWLADGPDGPIWVGSSLAIQDRAAIVEIPTLNSWGSLALLLILGSVGWVRLRSLASGTPQTKSTD